MKKLFTLSIMAMAFVFGSFSSFAQEENTTEQLHQASEKKAYNIADEVGLNDDERLLLVRQILTRELTLAKVEASQENPNSTQDLSKYVTEANAQFKKNVSQLFGVDRAKQILELYTVED